jgi:Ca2+-transporting ATPase
MGAYLLVWQRAGVGFQALRELAPQLLQHTAAAPLQALQLQASSVAFCTIVFCQVGVLLACRSEGRSGIAMLKVANPLLWLGLLSEGLVLAALLWIPPVARVFALVPTASQWFGVLWLAPLLILLADDLRKAARPTGWIAH